MKILFVCKYNRFRSRIAEAYFKKINRNKKITAKSAGIIIGKPVARSVKQIAKKLGFRIFGKPKAIKESLLEESDLLVIVANDVPSYLFAGRVKKIIVWKISDTNQADLKSIERISGEIMKKVEKLVKSLEKRK